jgi:hypothetical protein
MTRTVLLVLGVAVAVVALSSTLPACISSCP